MKKLFIYSLLALSGFLLPACGDDEKKQNDPQPIVIATPTKTELLTGRNWTIINRKNVQNYNSGLPDYQSPCLSDNIVKFETDGTIKRDEGPTKCNSTVQQTTFGTWSFFDNENQIYIDNQPCLITELTETVFKYKRTIIINGVTYIDTFHYEHK